MRTAIFLAAASVLFAVPGAFSGGKTIETEKEFRALLVGKRLVDHRGDWAMLNADDTIDGVFEGEKLTGSWSWKDRYLCRDAKLGDRDFKDCQVWSVDGSIATVTRNEGKGASVEYRIEEP